MRMTRNVKEQGQQNVETVERERERERERESIFSK